MAENLGPALSGPVTTHTRGDASVSAYPLHLEDGQTLTIPMVAIPLAQVAHPSRWVARGSTPRLDLNRGGFTWWSNLPKGETMALPLGPLGELGVGRG